MSEVRLSTEGIFSPIRDEQNSLNLSRRTVFTPALSPLTSIQGYTYFKIISDLQQSWIYVTSLIKIYLFLFFNNLQSSGLTNLNVLNFTVKSLRD